VCFGASVEGEAIVAANKTSLAPIWRASIWKRGLLIAKERQTAEKLRFRAIRYPEFLCKGKEIINNSQHI
jgi:hypothetical protein